MRRCRQCGGKFGLVVHRWWGERFCTLACKKAFLHKAKEDRDKLKRWLSFLKDP